jgi:hypothetical protein
MHRKETLKNQNTTHGGASNLPSVMGIMCLSSPDKLGRHPSSDPCHQDGGGSAITEDFDIVWGDNTHALTPSSLSNVLFLYFRKIFCRDF